MYSVLKFCWDNKSYIVFLPQNNNYKKKQERGEEETLESDGYVYDFDVMIVSLVYTHLWTHQVIHILYVKLFTCQSYLNIMSF